MAAMAKPTSKPLTVAGAAAGRLAAGFCAGAEAAGFCAMGAAEARGAAGAGAAAAGAAGATGAAEAAPVGPPGGNVGNLIVGAAEGFGGRLMRTVSFFGCTLPVSFLGGTAPAGTLGMFSAIKSLLRKIESCRIVSNSYSPAGRERRRLRPYRTINKPIGRMVAGSGTITTETLSRAAP